MGTCYECSYNQNGEILGRSSFYRFVLDLVRMFADRVVYIYLGGFAEGCFDRDIAFLFVRLFYTLLLLILTISIPPHPHHISTNKLSYPVIISSKFHQIQPYSVKHSHKNLCSLPMDIIQNFLLCFIQHFHTYMCYFAG